MAEHGAICGVGLALEHLNRFEIYLLDSAAECTRFVREAIHDCATELRHVHISENDRSTPWRGQVVWEETFDELARIGYDGWLTIEAFGLALPSLAAATRIWRKILGRL